MGLRTGNCSLHSDAKLVPSPPNARKIQDPTVTSPSSPKHPMPTSSLGTFSDSTEKYSRKPTRFCPVYTLEKYPLSHYFRYKGYRTFYYSLKEKSILAKFLHRFEIRFAQRQQPGHRRDNFARRNVWLRTILKSDLVHPSGQLSAAHHRPDQRQTGMRGKRFVPLCNAKLNRPQLFTSKVNGSLAPKYRSCPRRTTRKRLYDFTDSHSSDSRRTFHPAYFS